MITGAEEREYWQPPRGLVEGERLKEEGQQRARNSTPGLTWGEQATEWFENEVGIGLRFTSDTLTSNVGIGGPAQGAWFSKMSRRGRIVRTGVRMKSTMPQNHAALIDEWRRVS